MTEVRADGLLVELERYAAAKLERLGELFVEQAEIHAPKRTRATVDSIEKSTVTVTPTEVTMTIRVTATSDDGEPYPTFQNEGTGIFGPEGRPITPKREGGVLVFDWPAAGGIVFARSVRGTEPTRWWDKTVNMWPDMLRRVEQGG